MDASKNRILFVNDFTEKKGRQIVERMFELDAEDPKKDIVLVVSSYGGDVYELMTIYDAMQLVRCDVATLALGKALSSGLLLLFCGTSGKRFITPNTTLLSHEMSVIAEGMLTDIKTEMKENARQQKMVHNLFIKHTKIKEDELTKMNGRDMYITPKQALKYGMVDHIISTSAFWDKISL